MTTAHSVASWIGEGGFQALASLGLWATIVLSLAWLISRGLRWSSAAVRYCLWQSALVSMLVLPLLYAFVPGVPLGLWVIPAEESVGEAEPRVVAGSTIESTRSVQQPLTARKARQTTGTRSEPASADALRGGRPDAGASTSVPTSIHASWPLALTAVWVLGALIHFAFLALYAIRARRLVRCATPLRDMRCERLLNELASRFSIKRAVELLESPRIQVPIAQ
ncbi:MAG: M56 family metallopeptidase, partial [Planctomycetota bacterium]